MNLDEEVTSTYDKFAYVNALVVNLQAFLMLKAGRIYYDQVRLSPSLISTAFSIDPGLLGFSC